MRWLAASVLLMIVLAGCSGGEEPTSTTSTASATTTSRTVTATNTTTEAPNRAPTATLTADKLAGAAPLTVNFTLAATDPDGDAIKATLAIGSAAATSVTVPGSASHAFAEPGTYKVVLTVSDGVASSNSSLLINVDAKAVDITELCPTDSAAVTIPSPDVTRYATPADTADSPGALWIYEEANGLTGLQRNDDTQPTTCPSPDLIVF